MNSRQCRRGNNGSGTSGPLDLMDDVISHFLIVKSPEVIMDCDALAERFVHGFTQDVVQVRLTAEDQGKAVQGVIFEVHQHFQVVEYGGVEMVGLINGQDEGLAFFFIQVEYLLLDCPETPRLPTLVTDAEDIAEGLIELCDTDRGEAHVLHAAKVRVQLLFKAAQPIGFPHPAMRSEDADPTDILQIIQAFCHLAEILGMEMVLLPDGFAKGIASEPIVIVIHGRHLPFHSRPQGRSAALCGSWPPCQSV